MDAWLWWVIAAGVLAAGEVTTLAFVLGMFAIGALAGALVAALGADTAIQFVVAAAVSLVMLVLVRPIARRHMNVPRSIRSGAAALVGESALVLDAVGIDDGRVRLRGEVWTARSFDGDEIAPGTRVEVVRIEGATALVRE